MLVVVLISVTLIFLTTLIIKKVFGVKWCAICGGILLTWLGLFLMYRLGYVKDEIVLALLMGQSITGIYYFISKRVVSSLRIFTLPFMLTLLTLAYFSITWSGSIILPLLILLVLWILAYAVFVYRNDPGKKMLADAAMNCCDDK